MGGFRAQYAWVIENGRIIESGRHEDLLAGNGHYRALYTHQLQQEFESAAMGGEERKRRS